MDLATVCLTPLLHYGLPPNRPLPQYRDASETRNVYEEAPNLYETDHFAVWYGYTVGWDPAGLPLTGDALEAAWDAIVMSGLPQGEGTDQYKFNVYVGDTGGPSARGSSGYYWYDTEGWPMLVLRADEVGTENGEVTAAHEYFHAVQDATHTYSYEDQAAFWFEATATWFEHVVFPERDSHATFVWSLAFLPDLPLWYFEYPDRWAPEPYHQYGVAAFAAHLEGRHDPELVYRSWDDERATELPLETVALLLEDRGDDLTSAFFDFVGANATWDSPYEDAYLESIELYGGYASDWSRRPTGRVRWPAPGVIEPREYPPMSFGANYWYVSTPPAELTARFEGDSGASWAIGLAARREQVHWREVRVLDGTEGSVTLAGLADADEVWFFVTSAGGLQDDRSRFDYSFTLDGGVPARPTTDEEEEPIACGCSASSTGAWFILAFPAILRLRSRSR